MRTNKFRFIFSMLSLLYCRKRLLCYGTIMKDTIFTLVDGKRARENPDEKYPKIVQEAFQVFECTWAKENNVSLITEKEMEQIQDKRNKEKNK